MPASITIDETHPLWPALIAALAGGSTVLSAPVATDEPAADALAPKSARPATRGPRVSGNLHHFPEDTLVHHLPNASLNLE